jgi:thiol-disulfide isomerase/thioredoxin
MNRTSRFRRLVAPAVRGSVLLAVFVLAAVLAAPPTEAQGSFSLPGLAGGSLSSADVADGTTVLVVWASWSPRCRDIVPRVNEVASRFGGRARVVTVNFQEERAAVEAFLAGKGLTSPVYLDQSGDFAKAHAVTTLPGLIVYRAGEVRFQGRLEADAPAQIEGLLK